MYRLAVSASECTASASMAAEPLMKAVMNLKTAMARLTASATYTTRAPPWGLPSAGGGTIAGFAGSVGDVAAWDRGSLHWVVYREGRARCSWGAR